MLSIKESQGSLVRSAFQAFAKKKREESERRKEGRQKKPAKKKRPVEEDEDGEKKAKKSSQKSKKKKLEKVSDSDEELEVTAEIRREYEASCSARREQTRSKEARKAKKEKELPAPQRSMEALIARLEPYTTPLFPWDPMYTTDPPGPICSRNFHESHTENLEQLYSITGPLAKQATMFTVHCNVSFLSFSVFLLFVISYRSH